MLEEPFMDRVQQGLTKLPSDKSLSATFIKYRALLRQAMRFRLDDDFVRLATNMSHDYDRLIQMNDLAELPYDVAWFEFDNHTRLRELDDMGKLATRFDPE